MRSMTIHGTNSACPDVKAGRTLRCPGHLKNEPAPLGKLSSRELATVLAALRLWQQEDPVLGGFVVGHDQLQAIRKIATDNGEFEPLTPTEIDSLCERLNQ